MKYLLVAVTCAVMALVLTTSDVRAQGQCEGRGPHIGVDGMCCGTSVKLSECGFGFARDWDCREAMEAGDAEFRESVCSQLREQGTMCPAIAPYCGACSTLDLWCFFANLPWWALLLLIALGALLAIALFWGGGIWALIGLGLAGGSLAITALGVAQDICHVRTAGRRTARYSRQYGPGSLAARVSRREEARGLINFLKNRFFGAQPVKPPPGVPTDHETEDTEDDEPGAIEQRFRRFDEIVDEMDRNYK